MLQKIHEQKCFADEIILSRRCDVIAVNDLEETIDDETTDRFVPTNNACTTVSLSIFHVSHSWMLLNVACLYCTRPLLADVTDDVAAAGQKLSSGAWEPLYLSADSLIGFNHHDDDRCDGALRLRFKNEHGTAVCREAWRCV